MFTLTTKSGFTRTTMAFLALMTVFAVSPQPAEAGRTGWFIGGLAAGVAGLVALDVLTAPRDTYVSGSRYYVPPPSCPSVATILRRLTNKGFYDFRNESHGSRFIRVTAHKRGYDYRLKLTACSGRLVSRHRI